jgi:three-Cys-motif partner protein
VLKPILVAVSEQEYYSGGGEKTIAKTVILDKYLGAYLNIMNKPSNWAGQKWYVDTHAGTGFTRELGVDIPGSALRALDHDFDRFYLYEKNPDNFETLVKTLNEETDASLTIGELNDVGIPMASGDDPYVRIMNMDCNDGVRYLARKGRRNAHWFTFVDPEKLSVERDLMEHLCRRGNMDILFNFQTSAFFRNGQASADHSHDKVALNLGEDFPRDGTPDQYVEHYKEKVFGELGWKSASRKMESEGDNDWRYDLIFASTNETALGIIGDIYTSDLKNDVTSEIREWRIKSDVGQAGFGAYVDIPTEDETPDSENQSQLGDF